MIAEVLKRGEPYSLRGVLFFAVVFYDRSIFESSPSETKAVSEGLRVVLNYTSISL